MLRGTSLSLPHGVVGASVHLPHARRFPQGNYPIHDLLGHPPRPDLCELRRTPLNKFMFVETIAS